MWKFSSAIILATVFAFPAMDVFFLPKEVADKITEEYHTRKRLEAEERAIVRRLIAAEGTR